MIAARDFTDFAARATLAGDRVDPRSRQFLRYLVATIGVRATETVLAIYVDGNQGFLAHEILAMGSETAACFPTRFLIARALEVGAQGIVLAHNHPSGIAAPSEQDREATNTIRTLTASLGIELFDHLIIARGRIFSMASGETV